MKKEKLPEPEKLMQEAAQVKIRPHFLEPYLPVIKELRAKRLGWREIECWFGARGVKASHTTFRTFAKKRGINGE